MLTKEQIEEEAHRFSRQLFAEMSVTGLDGLVSPEGQLLVAKRLYEKFGKTQALKDVYGMIDSYPSQFKKKYEKEKSFVDKCYAALKSIAKNYLHSNEYFNIVESALKEPFETIYENTSKGKFYCFKDIQYAVRWETTQEQFEEIFRNYVDICRKKIANMESADAN